MEPPDPRARPHPEEKRFLNPSDEKTKYIIAPQKGTDQATRADIEEYIKKITQTESIYSFTDQTRGKFMWWTIHATKEQYEQIKEYKGVGYASAPPKLSDRRAIPSNWTNHRESSHRSVELDSFPLATKRDAVQGYKAQANAPKELRQISIPKGSANADEWPDYIYNIAAGEGFYIYYISNVCSTG